MFCCSADSCKLRLFCVNVLTYNLGDVELASPIRPHKSDTNNSRAPSARPTVVGAGSRVFGAGFADDVLVDLAPFGLVVTPKEQQQQLSDLFNQNIFSRLLFSLTPSE